MDKAPSPILEELKSIDEINKQLEETLFRSWNRLNLIFDKIIHHVPSKERIQSLINHSKGEVQRTEEWYARREGCITASDIGAVLGMDKSKKREEVIINKCGYNKFTGNQYTRFGQQYEPLATAIYEHLFKVKVFDAPLLIHPVFPFIGASTDGFIIDEANDEGALLEIKCPFKRIPKEGFIPEHYWAQVQTQMEVAKIDKAYFFDCQFEIYPNEEAYLSSQDLKDPILKGPMIKYLNIANGRYEYIYPTIFKDGQTETAKELRAKLPEKHTDYFHFEYWKLVKFVRVEIHRDQEWFYRNLLELKGTWLDIKQYRTQELSERELKEAIKSKNGGQSIQRSNSLRFG